MDTNAVSSGLTPKFLEIAPTVTDGPEISYSNARIAALYAQGLVDYLRSREVDLASLGVSAVSAAADNPDQPQEISLADWIRLLEAATRQLNEPELPARAGASLQPRHLGALGRVLMGCANLHEAYRQLARYIRLLGQIGQPELQVDGAQARLIWHWPYDSAPPQSVALFMLAARVRFMRWLSDRPDQAVDADFHGPAPGPTAGFEKIFGGRVRFDAPASLLRFNALVLDAQVVTADESFRKAAEERAERQLAQLNHEPTLIQQIKGVLLRRLASGQVALGDTAEALHMSARTLQRRLTELDANYQQVLDQVRASCSANLIRDPQLPLAEVAFLLGYSDQSTFNTAYKRWFGASPGQARRKAVDRREQPRGASV